MYEIIIKNLENQEEVERMEAEHYLAVAMFDDVKKPDAISFCGTIDALSATLAGDCEMCAACRLAVAKHDGVKDIKEKQTEKAIRDMLERLR